MGFPVMEVCGTHTHALIRYGIRQLYRESLDMISGPGCPVCVTSQSDIDILFSLCSQGIRLYSFGDLLKVPGRNGTLRELRAQGGDIREVYSPLNVVKDMIDDPTDRAVFAAIGFETTAPLVASLVEEIEEQGISGLYIYSLLKLIPPAMEAILADNDCAIEGFICPGHVSVIIGEKPFRRLAREYSRPLVIAGFEETFLRNALDVLVAMLKKSRTGLVNAYSPLVRPEGNRVALEKISQVFDTCDTSWRGIGDVARSGLKLKDSYRKLDAEYMFSFERTISLDPCPCGDVLRGKIKPADCNHFGVDCDPVSPIGPCMVSCEGACHAEFLYGYRST